jgi:hypothetical protein
MPTYRMTIVVCIQNLSEVYDALLPGGNNQCYGTTWGALLPWYDGMSRLGPVPSGVRTYYPSSMAHPLMDSEPMHSSSSTAQYTAPAYWWQSQEFEDTVAAAPSFVVAWGAKANMGTGFNVQ